MVILCIENITHFHSFYVKSAKIKYEQTKLNKLPTYYNYVWFTKYINIKHTYIIGIIIMIGEILNLS